MSEPSWLMEARSLLGVREIVGAKHSAIIMGWVLALGAKVLGSSSRMTRPPGAGPSSHS